MDAKLEKYLDTVDKHLKPLPVSERVDIVKEVKASMQEMQAEGLSSEQILARLGDAKDLARAYLGDLLAESNGFSWTRVLTVCAFYSLVRFSGHDRHPVSGDHGAGLRSLWHFLPNRRHRQADRLSARSRHSVDGQRRRVSRRTRSPRSCANVLLSARARRIAHSRWRFLLESACWLLQEGWTGQTTFLDLIPSLWIGSEDHACIHAES